jgi:glycosyltransferase involved in cell wall biosynthesis
MTFKLLRCHPKKTRKNNSCYEDNTILLLKEEWNKKNVNNKITATHINAIWQQLKYKILECENELCWLDKLVTDIKKKELTNSFAPIAPLNEWKKYNNWLSSTDFNKVMKQYMEKHPNFLYLGPSPIDFDTIVNAALILKEKNIEVNWVIIGDGRAKQSLIDKVFELELVNNFHFIGIRPSEEMPFYFSCADVLLVSLKDTLIFSLTIPSKVQSYLACKKPIIANINGIGAKTIIDSKSGLVSNSGDFQMLANNIEEMVNKNSFEMNTFAINGYNYFLSNFERKIIYDKLEENLNTLHA